MLKAIRQRCQNGANYYCFFCIFICEVQLTLPMKQYKLRVLSWRESKNNIKRLRQLKLAIFLLQLIMVEVIDERVF